MADPRSEELVEWLENFAQLQTLPFTRDKLLEVAATMRATNEALSDLVDVLNKSGIDFGN